MQKPAARCTQKTKTSRPQAPAPFIQRRGDAIPLFPFFSFPAITQKLMRMLTGCGRATQRR